MKINIGKKIISTFKGFATEKKVSKKIDFIKNSKFTIYLQKMQIKNGKGHMRSGYGLSLPRLVLAAKHSMIWQIKKKNIIDIVLCSYLVSNTIPCSSLISNKIYLQL